MIKAVIFDMYETLITHYGSPLYFSEGMSKDADIDVESFRKTWRSTDTERTIGLMTFEEVIEKILRENDRWSEKTFNEIVEKRNAVKEELFSHLHPEIISLLDELKKRELKIGLITNCFSEEVIAIRKSPLFKYFDATCFSFEEKIKKPDSKIFIRCMKRLNVSAQECLYVGDGGSQELETSKGIGMKPVQAVWYLGKSEYQEGWKPGFVHAEHPLDVLNCLDC